MTDRVPCENKLCRHEAGHEGPHVDMYGTAWYTTGRVHPHQPDVRDLDDVTLTQECLRRFGTKPAKLAEKAEAIITERAHASSNRVQGEFPADDIVCDNCEADVNLDDAELVTFEDGESGYVCPKCAGHAVPKRVCGALGIAAGDACQKPKGHEGPHEGAISAHAIPNRVAYCTCSTATGGHTRINPTCPLHATRNRVLRSDVAYRINRLREMNRERDKARKLGKTEFSAEYLEGYEDGLNDLHDALEGWCGPQFRIEGAP